VFGPAPAAIVVQVLEGAVMILRPNASVSPRYEPRAFFSAERDCQRRLYSSTIEPMPGYAVSVPNDEMYSNSFELLLQIGDELSKPLENGKVC